jgi:hypothetical protein
MVKVFVFSGLSESELPCYIQFLNEYWNCASTLRWSSTSVSIDARSDERWFVTMLSDEVLTKAGVLAPGVKFLRPSTGCDIAMTIELRNELANWKPRDSDRAAYLFGFEENIVSALKLGISHVKLAGYTFGATTLHGIFGCSPACRVMCKHCSSSYERCQKGESSDIHCVMYSAGSCLNTNCPREFPMCVRMRAHAHIWQHVTCTTCGKPGRACNTTCRRCDYTSHCDKWCPKLFVAKTDCVSRTQCGLCNRALGTRAGLCSHLQTCCTKWLSTELLPYFDRCACGIMLLDEEHRKQHNPPKGKKCSPPPAEPARSVLPPAYADDKWYPSSTVRKAAAATPSVPGIPTPVPGPTPALPPAAPAIATPARPPATAPPAGPLPASALYGPIETAILAALSAGGDSSPLLALTAAEERRILAKAEELQGLLVKCPLGIASFQKQGSLAKGTAVPGFADVDIVVMFNKFTATALGRADLRKRVETALKNKESSAVFEGADDIVVCSYKDVSFDLILVGKCDAHNDARAVDFKKGLEDVNLFKAHIGTNGFVLDVIRACKYWAKRSAIEPALKSVLIEKIVLVLWAQEPRAQAEPLAAVKQRLFLSFLEYLQNRVYAQKAGGAQSAATDLDVLLRECQPTLERFSALLNQVAATGTK